MWELYLQKKNSWNVLFISTVHRGDQEWRDFQGLFFQQSPSPTTPFSRPSFFCCCCWTGLGIWRLKICPKKMEKKKSQGHLLILKLPPLGVLVGILVWMIFYQDTCFFVWSPCLNPNQGWLPVQCFQVSRAKSFSSRCRTVWNGRTVRWLVGSGRNNT